MKHAKTSITDVPAPALSRRQVLRQILGAGVVLVFAGLFGSVGLAALAQNAPPAS